MLHPCVRLIASLVLMAAGLTACRETPQQGDARPPLPVAADVACGGIPQGACDLVVEDLHAEVPGAFVRIDLRCAPGPCTRSGGAGTAQFTGADGAISFRPWAYAGDSNEVPDPECHRINPVLCARMARDAIDQTAPDIHVQSVSVTCLGDRQCTVSESAVEIVVTAGDGAIYTSRTVEWDAGPGSTAPPADAKTPEP